MITVDKATRNEIYTVMLSRYNRYVRENLYMGLCYMLQETIFYDFPSINSQVRIFEYDKYTNFIETNFTELFDQKPKKIKLEMYWFNINDTKSRITILQNCIKQTENVGQ
jgi:hypothetical protein